MFLTTPQSKNVERKFVILVIVMVEIDKYGGFLCTWFGLWIVRQASGGQLEDEFFKLISFFNMLNVELWIFIVHC